MSKLSEWPKLRQCPSPSLSWKFSVCVCVCVCGGGVTQTIFCLGQMISKLDIVQFKDFLWAGGGNSDNFLFGPDNIQVRHYPSWTLSKSKIFCGQGGGVTRTIFCLCYPGMDDRRQIHGQTNISSLPWPIIRELSVSSNWSDKSHTIHYNDISSEILTGTSWFCLPFSHTPRTHTHAHTNHKRFHTSTICGGGFQPSNFDWGEGQSHKRAKTLASKRVCHSYQTCQQKTTKWTHVTHQKI